MHIGIPSEVLQNETRVAATPETVKKFVAQGHKVTVQKGAGIKASQPDVTYSAAGAEIADAHSALNAEMILKVHAPTPDELGQIKKQAIVIGMLNPFDQANNQRMAAAGITAFAMEAIPRSTRAQSMDVLSSQANIAGYKAMLIAANTYQRFIPMLMTAAGTVKAARVLILGAGVAGLQAIATAKRLGAVVEASDVRPAAKEQIESLGAKFIEVPFLTEEEREIAQGEGGYARSMPSDWLKRQAELVHERAKLADIIITTALIPGKQAPILLREETVKAMKPGSVIVDLAAGKGISGGGNCPLTKADKIIEKHKVILIGYTNLAAMVAADASALYARNLFDFIKLIVNEKSEFVLNRQDDIVTACMICHDSQLLREN